MTGRPRHEEDSSGGGGGSRVATVKGKKKRKDKVGGGNKVSKKKPTHTGKKKSTFAAPSLNSGTKKRERRRVGWACYKRVSTRREREIKKGETQRATRRNTLSRPLFSFYPPPLRLFRVLSKP